jgi:hypothetical protein
MRYRVRTPHGELEYPSLGDVEQAYVAGLIDPDDEVLEEGGSLWRKAATLPALVRAQARRTGSKASGRAQVAVILVAVVLGIFALGLVISGRGLFGLLLSIVVASLLFRVTMNAFKRPR